MRALLDAADPDATFWADFTGSVTATMAALVRGWPKTRGTINDIVRYVTRASSCQVLCSWLHRFRSTAEHGKKYKIHLEISINEEAAKGIDPDDLVDLFKNLKKQKHDGKKVTVAISRIH